MEQFTRVIGITSLISGIFLLAFPEATKQVMLLRAEYAQLSPGALRLFGGWLSLTGALLVATTTRPAVEARLREVFPSERRKAA